MNTKLVALCLFAMAAVTACDVIDLSMGEPGGSPTGATIGTTYGDIPPRLAPSDRGLHWTNTGAFGPVPPAELDRATAVCAKVPTVGGSRAAQPLGYHPQAQDQNGQTIPGGGFFCG